MWIIFKSHFKDVQVELKDIRGPIMQQVGYHHANMVAARLRADLQLHCTEMITLVQEMANLDTNPPIDN